MAEQNALGGGIQIPQQQTNPLGMISGLLDLQTKMNQNKLFQQEFAAKQRAGQIFSQSASPEVAMEAILKDSIAAPFAPAIVNSMRQANLALTQQQGAQQEQAKTGLESVLKALPEVLSDPDPKRFDKIMAGRLEALSPDARTRVAAVLPSIRSALYDGLPQDPEHARQTLGMRGTGLIFGAGFGNDVLHGLVGKPATRDNGGAIVSGVEQPAALGGGFVPAAGAAGAMPKTLAPQIIQPQVGPEGRTQPMVVGGAGGAMPLTMAGAPVVGPSHEEAKTGEKKAERASELHQDYTDFMQQLPESDKRIKILEKALGEFQAGGGADIRADAGKFLQALKNVGVPIDDKLIQKIANDNLAAGQIFDSQIKPHVLRQMAESIAGTGRAMKPEVDTFLALLSKNTDPAALIENLNQMRYNMGVKYDRAVKFLEYKQKLTERDPSVKGLGPDDFGIWYTRNFNEGQLPETNAGGTISFRKIDPTKVKGATPDALYGTYVPGKGIVKTAPDGKSK